MLDIETLYTRAPITVHQANKQGAHWTQFYCLYHIYQRTGIGQARVTPMSWYHIDKKKQKEFVIRSQTKSYITSNQRYSIHIYITYNNIYLCNQWIQYIDI